jgi:hypothetical protein
MQQNLNDSKLTESSLMQLETMNYKSLLELLNSTRQTCNQVTEHLVFKVNCQLIENAKENDFMNYLLHFNQSFDLNSTCVLIFGIRSLVVLLKCKQTRDIIVKHANSQFTLFNLIEHFAKNCQRDFAIDIDWACSPHTYYMLLIKCVMKRGNTIEANRVATAYENIQTYMCEFGRTQLKHLKDRFFSSSSSKDDNCSFIYTFNKFLRCVDISLNDNSISSSSSANLDKLHPILIKCLIESKLLEPIENDKTHKNESNELAYLRDQLKIRLLLISLKLLLKVKNKNDIDYFVGVYFDVDGRSKFDLVFQTGQDDDTLIDFNFYCLQRELELNNSDESIRLLFNYHLNAHVLFAKLLISISYDYQVLLDWLISNETNFLAYLVKYSKHLINEFNKQKLDHIRETLAKIDENSQFDFSKFKLGRLNRERQAQANDSLTKIFELFKVLGSRIKRLKSLFPYNCEPLLRLIEKISSLIY